MQSFRLGPQEADDNPMMHSRSLSFTDLPLPELPHKEGDTTAPIREPPPGELWADAADLQNPMMDQGVDETDEHELAMPEPPRVSLIGVPLAIATMRLDKGGPNVDL